MFTRRHVLTTAAGAIAAGFVGEGNSLWSVEKSPSPRATAGPLRVSPDNPRYFADATGQAVYLCGSHVWNNLVDMGPSDPPAALDFTAYLDFLTRYGHNFIRLWTWEHVSWDTRANGRWGKPKPHQVMPLPWLRTGPGEARDGKPKFDLTKFDPTYFQRLRDRVSEAARRGIYVSVMLFEGWAMQRIPDAWQSHPFHPDNNINGLDGDLNRDGRGLEIHTLSQRRVTQRQEAYVRKVIETVGDLDNVLYEISNENHPASTDWQYHMIRFVKQSESQRSRQHPVGMTFQYSGGSNKTLFESPADWISPNPQGGYRDNPPANDGRKVILVDTDHLWGIGGNRGWVWKSFLRGHNPIFMDPYDGSVLGKPGDRQWEPIRRAMGVTRRLAEQLDLKTLLPHGRLASTGYCLANPGKTYLVYLPRGGEVTVDLSRGSGSFRGVWIEPGTGRQVSPFVAPAKQRMFSPPGKGDWVLQLRST